MARISWALGVGEQRESEGEGDRTGRGRGTIGRLSMPPTFTFRPLGGGFAEAEDMAASCLSAGASLLNVSFMLGRGAGNWSMGSAERRDLDLPPDEWCWLEVIACTRQADGLSLSFLPSWTRRPGAKKPPPTKTHRTAQDETGNDTIRSLNLGVFRAVLLPT